MEMGYHLRPLTRLKKAFRRLVSQSFKSLVLDTGLGIQKIIPQGRAI